MNVLVSPAHADFLGNKLFSLEHALSSSWMQPNAVLKKCANAQGISLNTIDCGTPAEAQIIVFQDLPSLKADFERIRRNAPHAKLLLQLVESPLCRPQSLSPHNHSLFDAVLTYNQSLCSGKKYFHYQLPNGDPPCEARHSRYEQRRPIGLINSNRPPPLLGCRTSKRLDGFPLIGPLFTGWKVGVFDFLTQNYGELYSLRRRIVRTADRYFPDEFEAWGGGWKGEPIGWTHRFHRRASFKVARGLFKGEKIDIVSRFRFVIAFENLVNDCGYISEKIFDTFYGGAVPVYLGNKRIADFVPPECFIDASRFRSPRHLLSHLLSLDKAAWERYRAAIGEYLRSDEIKPFLPKAYADTMLNVFRAVVNS